MMWFWVLGFEIERAEARDQTVGNSRRRGMIRKRLLELEVILIGSVCFAGG